MSSSLFALTNLFIAISNAVCCVIVHAKKKKLFEILIFFFLFKKCAHRGGVLFGNWILKPHNELDWNLKILLPFWLKPTFREIIHKNLRWELNASSPFVISTAATKINTEIVTCFLGKCINQVKDFVLKPQPSSGQPKGWTIWSVLASF